MSSLTADSLRDKRLLTPCGGSEPQHRRVELHELQVSDLGARAQSERHAITRRDRWVGGLGKDLSEAPCREDHSRCQRSTHAIALPLSHHVKGDPLSRTGVIEEQIKGQGSLNQLDSLIQGNRCHQGPGNLRSGRIATRVGDAITQMTSFACE